MAAILWLVCARLGSRGRAGAWLRLLHGIGLALTPLLIVFFGRSALVAPVANLIAVPWVSAAVVPPALAGAVLAILWAEGATALFAGADLALHGLWRLLQPLAQQPLSQWHRPVPPGWSVLLAGVGDPMYCARGSEWHWDGVRFRFLHPDRAAPGRATTVRACCASTRRATASCCPAISRNRPSGR